MKEFPFERSTIYYDERISTIDEKICALIKQRKEISANHPGFPLDEYIAEWATKFNLYEDFLHTLFGILRGEEDFRPHVNPVGFQKYIPVLKSVVKDTYIYSVPFIRQYENASVISFNIDWEDTLELEDEDSAPHHSLWELDIDENFDCRGDTSSGANGHMNHHFVVSPPLPDDLSGIKMVFKEYLEPFRAQPTGNEIVVDLS